MGKILKLGFAMGGGVSLGSFSGSALTESVKLALLYGTDSSSEPFDDIEIDVFAGASAGAMSLGVLLKSLAFPEKATHLREQAQTKLKTCYGITDNDWEQLQQEKQSKLIDAQLAQDKMNEIWVEKITLNSLLQVEGGKNIPPLKFQCGILNKKTVVDIARDNLLPETGFYSDDDKAEFPLLGKRVLYGCSIANLNPLHAKAHEMYPVAKDSKVATNDALTSRQHKELRVFDINFEQVDTDKFATTDVHPKRWVRLHWGQNEANLTFDLRSAEDWKHIVATAVASGSFPFAFEPITLKRFKWEYPAPLWPFGESSNGNFTYIDGGVFNNEPVAEAFKLASHIDGQSTDTNYERRIIFVDPNVASDPEYKLQGLADYQVQDSLTGPLSIFKSFDGNDLIRKSSIDKLIGHAFSQGAASSAQAEAKAEHRTFQIANKLLLRNKLRESIAGAIIPSNSAFLRLKNEIAHQLVELSNKDLIPTLPSTIGGEIKRLSYEKGSTISELAPLADDIENCENLSGFTETQKTQIMTALVFSYIDIISGLSAKSRDSQLIAIGPFQKNEQNTFDKIFLPGSPIAAFAGFMSEVPSKYEVDTAQFCAAEFMQFAKLIPADSNPFPVPIPFDKQHVDYYKYMAEFKDGLKALSFRIEQMLKDSHILNWGLINSPLLSLLANFIKNKIQEIEYEEVSEDTIELRIETADKNFELDGKNTFDDDRHPIRLKHKNNALYLICFAKWDRNEKKWSGYNVNNGELIIDRDGFIRDTGGYVRIALPKLTDIEHARKLGYPVFWGKKKLVENALPSEDTLNDFWLLKNELTPFSELI